MHSVTPLVPTGLICRETFIFKKGCRFVTFRFFLRRDPSFTNVSLAYILEAFTVCITPLRHSYGLYCAATSLLRSVLGRYVTLTVCITPLRHSYGLYYAATSLLRSVLRRCVTLTVCIAPLRHFYGLYCAAASLLHCAA